MSHTAIPVYYFIILWQRRGKLDPRFKNEDAALKKRAQDKSLTPYRFLFEDYSTSKWFFEVIDLYRRVVMIGVVPLIGGLGVRARNRNFICPEHASVTPDSDKLWHRDALGARSPSGGRLRPLGGGTIAVS